MDFSCAAQTIGLFDAEIVCSKSEQKTNSMKLKYVQFTNIATDYNLDWNKNGIRMTTVKSFLSDTVNWRRMCTVYCTLYSVQCTRIVGVCMWSYRRGSQKYVLSELIDFWWNNSETAREFPSLQLSCFLFLWPRDVCGI